MNRDKLYMLHQMIKSQNTGTPKEAADKLGVSRATFFRYKTALEDLGAEVVWAHCWSTYIYGNHFEISRPNYEMRVSVEGKEFITRI